MRWDWLLIGLYVRFNFRVSTLRGRPWSSVATCGSMGFLGETHSLYQWRRLIGVSWYCAFMVANTDAFGSFLSSYREGEPGARFGAGPADRWSQEDVAARGGPERHLLGQIERGAAVDLTDAVFDRLDHAYGWPSGYARALVDFSVGEVHMPAVVDVDSWPKDPLLGFTTDTGEGFAIPTGGVHTRIPAEALCSIVRTWHQLTLIDIQGFDDIGALVNLAAWWENDLRGKAVSTTDQISTIQHIAVDPLPAISSLADARRLVLAVQPNIEIDRLLAAAATLLWTATLVRAGHNGAPADGLTALTSIAQAASRKLASSFPEWARNYRDGFFSESGLSNAAADPDIAAERFVGGLIRARDQLTNIVATVDDSGVSWQRRAPETVSVIDLTDRTLVFYDSEISPELPAIFAWATSTLRAQSTLPLTLQLAGRVPVNGGAVLYVEPCRVPTDGIHRGIRSTSINPKPVDPTVSGWDSDSRTMVYVGRGVLQRLHLPR